MSYDPVKRYKPFREFTSDVELIAENAIEYNPADDHTGRQIRHRAAELKDFLHSLLGLSYSFTHFYSVLFRSTQFYLILLSSTQFYLVLLKRLNLFVIYVQKRLNKPE